MSTSNLPFAAWEIDGDPLTDPRLFEGVLSRRVCAYLVDLCVIGVLWAVAALVLGVLGILSLGLLFPLIPVALGLVGIAYHGLTIGGPSAATPGMRLFGLEVRSIDGGRPAFLQALLMAVLFYLTIALTALLVLVVLVSPRRRTVHDFLSGVLVVRRDALLRLGA